MHTCRARSARFHPIWERLSAWDAPGASNINGTAVVGRRPDELACAASFRTPADSSDMVPAMSGRLTRFRTLLEPQVQVR
jgi:hypothetical protein